MRILASVPWRAMAALLPLLCAAQRATPADDDAKQATVTADPGRPIPDDRGGLAGRGGPDPIGLQPSFSATIGSAIYSTIGRPIGSTLPSRSR